MQLDFADFNQQRYEALVAEGLRKRDLLDRAAAAHQATQAHQRPSARPSLWARGRAWLIAVRMPRAARRSVEEKGVRA